jgi:hypothetical protein
VSPRQSQTTYVAMFRRRRRVEVGTTPGGVDRRVGRGGFSQTSASSRAYGVGTGCRRLPAGPRGATCGCRWRYISRGRCDGPRGCRSGPGGLRARRRGELRACGRTESDDERRACSAPRGRDLIRPTAGRAAASVRRGHGLKRALNTIACGAVELGLGGRRALGRAAARAETRRQARCAVGSIEGSRSPRGRQGAGGGPGRGARRLGMSPSSRRRARRTWAMQVIYEPARVASAGLRRSAP